METKKKADLEELLNSLIQRGWKPFGDKDVIRVKYGHSVHFLCRPIVNFVLDGYAEATVPLKEILTSRSSGLWQFVCENGMVKRTHTMWERYNADTGKKYGFYDDHSTYRIIESSLKDESELEDFILDNVKIGEN